MLQSSIRNWDLGAGLTIHQVPMMEFNPWYMANRSRIHGGGIDFNAQEVLDEHQKETQKKLNSKMGDGLKLALVLARDSEIIGWSFGRQESFEKFYQVNSAVFPDHRGKGYFKKLLKIMVELAQQEGFQIITSRHRMSNSEVIVPKLKFGFVISGFEMSDVFGTLVHLTYFVNPTRRKMMDFRCGQIKPDEQIQSLLKI